MFPRVVKHQVMLTVVFVVTVFISQQASSETFQGSVTAALHTQSNATRIPGEYIIALKEGVDVDTFTNNFDKSHAPGERSQRRYKNALRGFAARLTKKSLDELLDSKDVQYVEEDGIVQASSVVRVNDVASWGLDRIDQRDLPLDGTKDYLGDDGSGTHVYIIDTGTLSTHEEFSGRFSDQGFDAIGSPPEVGVDCNGHGTHTSGTATGSTYGVASQATVHSVRVLSCSGFGSTSGVIAGMDWVAKNAISPAVASMSLGGGVSVSMNSAVKRLYEAGVVISVAAGNENADACNSSPASAPEAITVAATDREDARASFSNHGPCVDIFAPGVEITSAWIGSNTASNTISGTSMACPHVTGAAAILLGLDETLTPAEVKEELIALSTLGRVSNPRLTENRLLYIGNGISDPGSKASVIVSQNLNFCFVMVAAVILVFEVDFMTTHSFDKT